MDNSGAMQSQLEMARNAYDLGSLNHLRTAAKDNDPEALRQAAEQFEAIFVQMLLKSMRQAQDALADEDSPFNSQQVKFYRDMHDTQLANDLSKSSTLGLADIIVRQLGNQQLLEKREGPRSDGSLEDYSRSNTRQAKEALNQISTPHDIEKKAMFASPEEFVSQLYPHAKQSAQSIGLAPEALIAQAAVETGWGQYMIHKGNGESANNLFGIKADNRWQGEKATVSTVEYDGDIAKRQKAQFRAYRDVAESMEDYVNFVQQNPRYSNAIAKTKDAESYFNALQDAGYATDPKYAEKVLSVLKSHLIQSFEPVVQTLGGAE